ncbi:hypothetical protein KIH39_14285 [Telmatocola sphagniphila]|uniref:Tail specific protease domain-containing protein n=1 Tax=Telmatocola sphagniphila TaxID=1123043 RepID=A0A8E6B3T4_9BACT|nr:S41 family peptidase [Telmatocola sphagniphila]QVL30033.1 hypothetical protein KIH39_14285 [Telmatocola sphagniphila]
MLSRFFVKPVRFALLAASLGICSPTISLAGSGTELCALAQQAEKAGRWEEALRYYNQVSREDRDTDYVGRMRQCLRHVLQNRRHQDPAVVDQILKMSFANGLKLFGEALQKLQNNYIEPDKCSPTRLFEEGLKEFNSSLADPIFRSRYLASSTTADIRLFQAWLKEFSLTEKPKTISEAQKSLEEVANRARKNLLLSKSNAVILEFVCGACHSLDEYTTYLPQQRIEEEKAENVNPTISGATLIRQGIGYLKILGFKESTLREMDEAINNMRMSNQPLRSLIIDLRGNPGGNFDIAVAIAQRFLPTGVIASLHGPTPEVNKAFQATGMNVIDLPLVLLVDQDTASSAEMLAAALGDNRRATVIGSNTFGKGSLQNVMKFKTGGSKDEYGREVPSPFGGLKITLAKLSGPSGMALSGIVPEIQERNPGRQMELAIDYALRKAQTQSIP